MSSCGCETNEHTGELLCEDPGDCMELLLSLESQLETESEAKAEAKLEMVTYLLEEFSEAYVKLCPQKAFILKTATAEILGRLSVHFESQLSEGPLLQAMNVALKRVLGRKLHKLVVRPLQDVLVL